MVVGLGLSGLGADQVGFFFVVGLAVGAEDVVEPEGWFRGVLLFPGIPRVDGLRFARYEAPVVGAYFFLFQEREDCFEGAASWPGHVFGADDGAVEAAKRFYADENSVGRVVVVEGDDVGVFELEMFHRAK